MNKDRAIKRLRVRIGRLLAKGKTVPRGMSSHLDDLVGEVKHTKIGLGELLNKKPVRKTWAHSKHARGQTYGKASKGRSLTAEEIEQRARELS